jgi:hypothetical protein
MDKAERLAQIMFEEDEIRHNNNEDIIYFTKEDFEAEQKERKNKMDITTMTKEELIALKKDITKELNTRIKKDYDELEKKLIELITEFERKTNYCVAVDCGDYDDRATNFIKGMFYYTDEYIEPYE